MKYIYDKGFTLVEVMVALAVVTIVSSSLFQMFVTTSHVNKDAQLIDLGNTIAVGQVENFKALTIDPVAGTVTMYYDSKGNNSPQSVAVIKVDSTVTEPEPPTDPALGSAGYFPSSVGTIDLSDHLDWDVQITPTHEVYFGLHIDHPVDPPGEGWTHVVPPTGFTIQNHVLPIKVVFISGDEPSRTIHLINKSPVEIDESTVEAGIYFFEHAIDTDDAVEQSVTLRPVSGYSSLTSVKKTTSKNTRYHLELKVSKLIGTVPQYMSTYSADKYFYH